MTKRVLLTVCALLLLSVPASARSKYRGSKRHLKLWDRVLYKRYERAQKLAEKAQQHASRGRYKEAVAILKRAIQIRPYAANLWFALGTVHSYSGAYKRCVKTLYKARKLDAKHKKNLAAFRLGLCLSMSGRISEGVNEYRKVHPTRWVTSAVLNWNMADNYMALGRLKEAAYHYRRSLQSNAGQRVLHFALAVAMDRAGKLRSADRQLKRANRLDPTGKSLDDKDIIWLPSHDHLYYRALRAYSLRRRGEALRWWQKFLQKAPSSPWAYVVGLRIKRLRTGAFTAADVSLDKGGANLDEVAAALTGAHADLRRCLGTAATPKLADLRGLRVGLVVSRRGVSRVTVLKRFGALPAGPGACVRTALRKVRWRRAMKTAAPITFSFSLVGP